VRAHGVRAHADPCVGCLASRARRRAHSRPAAPSGRPRLVAMRADADKISQPDDDIARLEKKIDEAEGEIRKVQKKIDELEAELKQEGLSNVAISKDPAVVQLRDKENKLRDEKNKLLELLLEKEARLAGGAGATAVRARPAPRPRSPIPLRAPRGSRHCLTRPASPFFPAPARPLRARCTSRSADALPRLARHALLGPRSSAPRSPASLAPRPVHDRLTRALPRLHARPPSARAL